MRLQYQRIYKSVVNVNATKRIKRYPKPEKRGNSATCWAIPNTLGLRKAMLNPDILVKNTIATPAIASRLKALAIKMPIGIKATVALAEKPVVSNKANVLPKMTIKSERRCSNFLINVKIPALIALDVSIILKAPPRNNIKKIIFAESDRKSTRLNSSHVAIS